MGVTSFRNKVLLLRPPCMVTWVQWQRYVRNKSKEVRGRGSRGVVGGIMDEKMTPPPPTHTPQQDCGKQSETFICVQTYGEQMSKPEPV